MINALKFIVEFTCLSVFLLGIIYGIPLASEIIRGKDHFPEVTKKVEQKDWLTQLEEARK